MNFQPSLLRNHFYPFVKPFLPIPNPVSTNASFLSKLFCQALKTSLQRFIASELQKPQKHPNTTQIKKPDKIEPQVIELLSSEEEVQNDSKMDDEKRETLGTNKLVAHEFEEKTDLSKDHAQFSKQFKSTIRQQQENTQKKTCAIRKQKNHKGSLRMKKHKYFRIEQNLDLTETVNVRSLPFSIQQLNRKRQALFMRSVQNWDDAGLEKKERREIRMLKN